ncbi:MAG: hypothetical protein ACXVCP_16315 [Bdellovibrio sp.]
MFTTSVNIDFDRKKIIKTHGFDDQGSSFAIDKTMTSQMLCLRFKYFLFIILMATSAVFAPTFAYCVQNFDTISEHEFIQSAEFFKRNPEYNSIMSELKRRIKELLKNSYEKSQTNHDYKIGSFPVAEFFRKLDSFELLQGNSDIPIQSDPQRESDFYLIGKNIGYINRQALSSSRRSLTALCIHVMLGSMGYQDENYQVTLSLILEELAETEKTKEQFNDLNFNEILPQNSSNYLVQPKTLDLKNHKGIYVVSDGGATGVGGGGDSSSVEMKLEILSYMLVRFNFLANEKCGGKWDTKTGFVKSVLYAQIESSKEIVSPTSLKTEEGKIKIIIPKQINEQVPSQEIVVSTLLRLCIAEKWHLL